MPPPIAADDIVEARFYFEQNGSVLMNVFHYRATAMTDPIDYEAALDYAASELAEDLTLYPQTWKNEASDTCTMYKIEVQRIFPTRTYHISKVFDLPGQVSEAVAPALPQNVQLSLTKVTSESGRGRTGRIEVPGATIDSVESGRLSAEGLTWMTAVATAVQQNVGLEDLNPSTLTPIVLYGFAPAGSPEVELIRIQDTVRISRRRTVGVGQ